MAKIKIKASVLIAFIIFAFIVGYSLGLAGPTRAVTTTIYLTQRITEGKTLYQTIQKTVTLSVTFLKTSTNVLTQTTTAYTISTRTLASTTYITKTITTTKTATFFGIEGAEIDLVAKVYKVIDGDTFDAFPSGRVRLADIDAPELSEKGGQEAKNALISLVLNKNVYLDVDDLYVMDKYNRLVCVIYIDYNSTHVLNVNKWLLENGYAKLSDYPNEFNPNTWMLYPKRT